MLSKIDVFYVFILSILRRSPRRRLGLKLPNYGLGAPPTRSSLHLPPLMRGQGFPSPHSFFAEHHARPTLPSVLLPYLLLSIAFNPTVIVCN
jgi:hypothetical protein